MRIRSIDGRDIFVGSRTLENIESAVEKLSATTHGSSFLLVDRDASGDTTIEIPGMGRFLWKYHGGCLTKLATTSRR